MGVWVWAASGGSMGALMPVRERRPLAPPPPETGPLDAAPLPLRALAAAAGAAFVSAVLVLVPLFVAWLASATADFTAWQAVQVGVDLWLLAQGAPLTADPVRVSLVPWLLTLLPSATLYWGAQRVAMGLPDAGPGPAGPGGVRRDVLVAGGAFAGSYGVIALVASVLGRQPGLSAHPVPAFLGPLALALIAYVIALRGRFADDPARLAPSLVWLWQEDVPAWLRRAVRPALVGAAVLLACGAVATLVIIGLGLGRVAGLYEAVDPGRVGGTVLTLGQLLYLPTAALWAVAFAAGPGFSVGAGSSVTWSAVESGPLPLIPVLGALPDPGPLPPPVALSVLLPVAVGTFVGWRCVRATPRLSSWRVRARAAAAGAILTGLVMTLAAALASGALGTGRLGHLGVNPLLVGGALTGELLVGAAVAVAFSGLRLRRLGSD